MNILVTGGAGYIGSMVARHLINAGHAVTVLDSLAAGNRDLVPDSARFIKAQIGSNKGILDAILPKIDAVFHFAASIEVGASMASPIAFFQNNVACTLKLLKKMLEHGVNQFIFSSTAAVYGEPQKLPVDESHPLNPRNPYGESKLMIESALAWLHKQNGLKYAVLRYFNAAGGAQVPGRKATNLIPIVLDVARQKRNCLEIFGTDYPTPDGTAIRDYIHVEDLATAHVLAFEALPYKEKLLYNLGTGKGASVLEVVKAARKITGQEIPLKISPRRSGDPAIMIASSEAIYKDLGWKAEKSELDTIIRSAWRELNLN